MLAPSVYACSMTEWRGEMKRFIEGENRNQVTLLPEVGS